MYFNILSKDKLEKMNAFKKELHQMITKRLKIDDRYYSLFDETIECILNNKSLHYFIQRCCRQGLKDKTPLNPYINLCHIEVKVNIAGGKEKMTDLVNTGFKDGCTLKHLMMAGGRNEKKIESLSFNLLNVLKTRDIHSFVQLLTRQYLSLGQSMPKVLVACLEDEETFVNYGDAFVVGLNSFTPNKEKKEDQNNEK